MVVLYVVDVPEFLPIVVQARGMKNCQISKSKHGYYRIEVTGEITLSRKAMHMKPAIWYGLFTGGLNGEIAEFDRDIVRVIGTNKPL
ncbi:hypothetical protein [Bosea sp. (in: a-proteobacteria)]|uniref:hypothetical protein n=1 Tax=Bosea sp. (in: a-proteobacteria) TaxID=1871050 RepID=UPI002B479309|nr:hypothetical protein [Bosea sp. (in: a-proteobacteria)]WRH56762.1 MAG: hypothetical protein RSE11_17205 [Bosea sp. (in: a-proteobacteria)]